jgi:hypothetical protein
MKKVLSSILIGLMLFSPLTVLAQADPLVAHSAGVTTTNCLPGQQRNPSGTCVAVNIPTTIVGAPTSGPCKNLTGTALSQCQNANAAAGALQQFNPNVNVGSGNTYGGVSISGVGGAIASCTNVGSFLVNGAASLLGKTAIGASVSKSLYNYTGGGTAVQTSDDKAQKDLESANRISQCLDGVAYAVAKNTLAQVTTKTLNWVNTGLNGNPLYVQNVGSYLNTIKNQQITAFLPTLRNSDPIFGNALQAAITFQITGNRGALGTLNTSLATPQAKSYNLFMADFSNGGWNSLLNPKYNPIGALFNATDTLTANIVTQQTQSQNEIQRNNGFLDLKRCVAYANNGQVSTASEAQCSAINSDSTYEACCTGQSADDSLACQNYAKSDSGGNAACSNITSDSIYNECCNNDTGDSAVCVAYNTSSGADAGATTTGTFSTTNGAGLTGTPQCTQYVTDTPGSIIANQVATITTSPTRQLEYANKINEVLGNFFDSFVNNLLSKGLRGSGSGATTANINFTSEGNNSVAGANSGVNQSSALGYQSTSSGSAIATDFDISRPQQLYAVLQTQYDFLNRTKDSQMALQRVIPTIGALDYCIPGPNPDWQNDVNNNWQTFVGAIQQANPKDTSTVEKIVDAIPVVGGFVGSLVGLFTGSGTAPALWTSNAVLSDKVTGSSIEVPRTFYAPSGHNDGTKTNDLQNGLNDAYQELINQYNYYATSKNTFIGSAAGNAFEKAAQANPNASLDVDGFLQDAYTQTDSIIGYNQAASTINQSYDQNISDTQNDIVQLEAIRLQINAIVANAKTRYIQNNPDVNVQCLDQAYQIKTGAITGVARQEPNTSDPYAAEEAGMVQHSADSATYFYNNQIQ